MKSHQSPLEVNREHGFTLIELMVAVAAFSIVSLAAFAVLSSGQRNALMNDQTVKVQQNVRLAMDLIARDIRMTGYGNPAANSLPPCVNHMDATDNAVGADLGPDRIRIMTVNGQVGVLDAPFIAGGTIQVRGLSNSVVNGSLLTLEGVFRSTVTGVGAAGAVVPVSLVNGIAAPAAYPAQSRVFDLACVTYTVSDQNGQVGGVNATIPPVPFQLLRAVGNAAAVPIVDGIESLQLAYALDVNLDGAIDDQNGGVQGTFDCLDFVPNNGPCTDFAFRPANQGTVTAIPAAMNQTPSPVRQVRITVVGRAIPPANFYVPNNCWRDPTFTGASQIQAEDQLLAPASVNPVLCNLKPTDPLGIRRRALTRVVSLRETTLN